MLVRLANGRRCAKRLPCSGGFVGPAVVTARPSSGRRIVEGSDGRAVAVDAQERAFLVGTPGPSFTTTPDAFQPSPGPGGSLGLAVVPLGGTGMPEVEYATYAGAALPPPGRPGLTAMAASTLACSSSTTRDMPSFPSSTRYSRLCRRVPP